MPFSAESDYANPAHSADEEKAPGKSSNIFHLSGRIVLDAWNRSKGTKQTKGEKKKRWTARREVIQVIAALISSVAALIAAVAALLKD